MLCLVYYPSPQLFSHFYMASRCCHPIQNEFTTCYASVLAFGDKPNIMQDTIREIEEATIVPCFTAWCPR